MKMIRFVCNGKVIIKKYEMLQDHFFSSSFNAVLYIENKFHAFKGIFGSNNFLPFISFLEKKKEEEEAKVALLSSPSLIVIIVIRCAVVIIVIIVNVSWYIVAIHVVVETLGVGIFNGRCSI